METKPKNRGIDFPKWVKEDNNRIEIDNARAREARNRRLAERDAEYAKRFPNLVRRIHK